MGKTKAWRMLEDLWTIDRLLLTPQKGLRDKRTDDRGRQCLDLFDRVVSQRAADAEEGDDGAQEANDGIEIHIAGVVSAEKDVSYQ